MSKSKFQELVDINTKNNIETAEYVKENYEFIRLFTNNLSKYLGNQELVLINSKRETYGGNNNIEDFITIKNDSFFEFRLYHFHKIVLQLVGMVFVSQFLKIRKKNVRSCSD